MLRRADCAELLVDKYNASVLVSNKDGTTPLHKGISFLQSLLISIAIEQNQIQFIQFLFSHGADVNVGDATGNTPLHIAAQRGLLPSCEVLIARGAKLNTKNTEGWSRTLCCRYNLTPSSFAFCCQGQLSHVTFSNQLRKEMKI